MKDVEIAWHMKQDSLNNFKNNDSNHSQFVDQHSSSNNSSNLKKINKTRFTSSEELILQTNLKDGVTRRDKERQSCEIEVDDPNTIIFEDENEVDAIPSNAFVRNLPVHGREAETSTSASKIARLSMAIRRSLRLGSKRTSTALLSQEDKKLLSGSEGQGAPFTDYTELRQEPCYDLYGTLEELKYLLQLNRLIQVKKFVRHNDWPVSHEIRADLWRILCYNKDFETNKFLYTQQLDDLTRSGVKTYRPSFLLMDGIVIHDHGLKEQGAVTLQKLLIVIECVRPEIRFVPILYPLCAMFLHYMNAEETFACVMRLLSQGHTYVLQSELAVYASCHTLLSLLKKHKKSVYSMLKRRVGAPDDTKLAEVFSQWNAWIFKYMPFEYLVRVIDCFLVEGHKMLLRVTLSLVYVWYKERSRTFGLNTTAHNVTSNNNNSSGGRFPLIRSSAMPAGRGGKLSMSGLGDTTIVSSGKLSAVDQNIADVNEQIVAIAQNCPISVQTLLDMGCAIRNFKHSAFEQRQKHYENKFRDKVARIRSEKMNARPFRSIYTAAFESKIIDTEAASELIAALPSRFQLETPEILFRLSEHGASFVQLWSQIDDAEQTLLIIRSTAGEVFGAYCSSCWSERRDVRERAKTRYFGTGESFVWLLHTELRLPVIYPWAGQNSDHPDTCPQMFMTAGDKYMIIGSGGEGDAIAIRDELTRGLSYPCDTFASPELITTGNAFEIDEMEVYMVFSTGGARD